MSKQHKKHSGKLANQDIQPDKNSKLDDVIFSLLERLQDEVHEVRTKAEEDLKQLGGLFKLINMMSASAKKSFKQQHLNEELVRSAIENMGDTNDIHILKSALKSDFEAIRIEAIEFLELHNSAEADRLLIYHALHDRSVEVRLTAVRAMNGREDERYLDVLLKILDSQDKELVHWAIYGVCKIRSSKATDKLKAIYKNIDSYPEPHHLLIISILNSLKEQHDPEYFELCFRGLQHKKTADNISLALRINDELDTETIELLLKTMVEGNQLARQESAYLLACAKDMRALPVLLNMTESSKVEVRLNAIVGFSHLCDFGRETDKIKNFGENLFAKAESALLKMITDTDDEIRFHSIKALHHIGSPHAIIVSIDALNDPSHRVTFSASRVLSESDTPEAINAMTTILKSSNESLNILNAIEGILKSGDKRAQELFIPLLNSDDLEIQVDAAKALLKLGDKQGWDLLVNAMNNEGLDLEGIQRAIIANSLAGSGDSRAVDALLDALERMNCGDDDDDDLLHALIVNLGKLGDRRAVEAIKKWIGYGFPNLYEDQTDIASEALMALGVPIEVGTENKPPEYMLK